MAMDRDAAVAMVDALEDAYARYVRSLTILRVEGEFQVSLRTRWEDAREAVLDALTATTAPETPSAS
jgi:hypothetical protein